MTPAPAPVPSLSSLVSAIVAFFSNRSLHKLAATALGAGGLAVGNKFDAILGASYASLMHLTGGLKKLPD